MIINQCGLSKHLLPQHVVSVTDEGLPLKHLGPESFQRVLDITGIPAKEAIMIEDTPNNLLYPRAMGMQTVLIERGQGEDPGHAQHVYNDPVDFLRAYCQQVKGKDVRHK